MNETSGIVDRLMILENRISHQDATIDDLNQMVNKQWAEIEKLQRRLSEQRAHLTRIESNLQLDKFGETPPHF